MGHMLFELWVNFMLQYRKWPPGGIGNKAWWKHHVRVYNTMMTNFLKAVLQFRLVEILGD